MLIYCERCGRYINGYSLDPTPEQVEWDVCDICGDIEAQEHYRRELLNDETHATENYGDDQEDYPND